MSSLIANLKVLQSSLASGTITKSLSKFATDVQQAIDLLETDPTVEFEEPSDTDDVGDTE